MSDYTHPPLTDAPFDFCIDTGTHGPASVSTTIASALAWGTQYQVIYVPTRVPMRVIVRKLWVRHGATGTGNFDVGVYDAGGAKLISSGSTAKTAAAALKVVDVTDTAIGPGLYYLALCADSGTDTYYGDGDAAPLCAAMGLLTETLGSVTLPTTATWTVNQTLALYPSMGMFFVTTVS